MPDHALTPSSPTIDPSLLEPHAHASPSSEQDFYPPSPPLAGAIGMSNDATAPAAGAGLGLQLHPSLDLAAMSAYDRVVIKTEQGDSGQSLNALAQLWGPGADLLVHLAPTPGPAFDIEDAFAQFTHCEQHELVASPPASQPAPAAPLPYFDLANLPPLPTIEEHYAHVAREFNGQLESPLDESPFESPYDQFDGEDFGLSPYGDAYLQTPELSMGGLSIDHDFDGPLFGAQPSSQQTVVPDRADDIAVDPELVDVKPEPNDLDDGALWGSSSQEDPDAGAKESQDEYVPPAPAKSRKRKSSSSSSASSPGPKRRYTGTRAVALLDTSAPIQPRVYVSESRTSRKQFPKAIMSKARRQGIDMDDPEVDDIVQERRAQNTLAARQSRQRKAAHLAELDSTIVQLQGDLQAHMQLVGSLREANGALMEENGILKEKLRRAGFADA